MKMKKLMILLFGLVLFFSAQAQTQLTEAEDFHVKTIYSEIIDLFPLLDEENMIVVLDFFTTS
jgi:hypothetical protein